MIDITCQGSRRHNFDASLRSYDILPYAESWRHDNHCRPHGHARGRKPLVTIDDGDRIRAASSERLHALVLAAPVRGSILKGAVSGARWHVRADIDCRRISYGTRRRFDFDKRHAFCRAPLAQYISTFTWCMILAAVYLQRIS